MKYLEFTKQGNNLVITALPEGLEELAEMRESHPEWSDEQLWTELCEYQICNGWEWVQPEEVSALTGSPILSDSSQRDDSGKLVHVDRVYWFPSYQVESELERLEGEGQVVYVGS